ncbi:hypothetical protein [Acinetobacter sp. YH12140]|uniref:hypothetical protein n=1 Tax=Acinetobacter sp. YH12140 TaxID=2601124 RepID=UPI00211EAB4E|nr:hypothetical protein [Acinetobacter sp. YH12140]
MNLIEQLGGYSQAKNWLDKNEIHVKHGYLEKYRLELLEHRRANNIFEMGDYIIHEDELMVFAMWSEKVSNCAYIGYAYAEDGFLVKNDEFRHATPEEIKAGKRSEVKSEN